MKEKRDPSVYSSSDAFEKFLAWCDEKEKVAAAIKNNIPKPCFRMLDIGAGSGELTVQFESDVQFITALEPEQKLQRRLAEKLERATLIASGFEDASFSTSFDFILSSHSLYYFEDLARQLKRIRDLLSKDGVFVAVFKATRGEL